MNILFISPNSPLESIGGVERYITNLISFYEEKDSAKTVILLPTYGESYTTSKKNVTLFYDKSIGLLKSYLGRDIHNNVKLFSKNVEGIILKNKIDVICAENFHVGLPAAYSIMLNMVAEMYKIPLILKMHSFASTDLQIELVNQLMWKKISCVSKSVAGDCFQKGADINILSTNYLGVNTNEFNTNGDSGKSLRQGLGLPNNSKIILTATRIIHGRKSILGEKGIINLIQSFSKLSPHYPNLYLLIAVGKPPDYLKEEFDQTHKMLLGYLKLNNIEEKTIVKMFELHEMPKVYKQSDIFTLPSENETFGQVFIEAMGCGIPVVGTNVGGIPEIISDSHNGYLIPPKDSSVLAQMLEKLLNDRITRNRLVKSALKTVQDTFTSEKQFESFHHMLQKFLEENKISGE